MSWKMDGPPKVKKLTKSLAQRYSGMPGVPHDRPFRPSLADALRIAFENKKFRTCEWAECYCKETKQTYRVNGKHSSTVLSELNGTFPKDLHVVCEKYICDDLEDVAQLYSTFDTRISARTTGDINRIYAAVCPELDEVSPRSVNLTITGVTYYLWGDDGTRHPAEDRARLIVSNTEFAQWLDNLCGHGDAAEVKHIKRGPVAAAMYATWLKSKKAATEFWEAVRDASAAKNDDPSRKLEKLLRASHVRGVSRTAKVLSSKEMYSRCIQAWNAFRKGTPTDLRYYEDKPAPLAV